MIFFHIFLSDQDITGTISYALLIYPTPKSLIMVLRTLGLVVQELDTVA